jgi:hypothetical protein
VPSDELSAILDEEIGRLPERFRLPVVLCYLGGRTTDEAARVLGCPRGTVLSRLATARTRLAARLTRRGVTVPAALFAVAPVSSGLGAVAPLVPTAVRMAFGKPATGSAAVALAQGVITAMKIGKTITTAGVFFFAVALVTGAGLVATGGPAPEAARAEPPGAAPPPQKGTPPTPPPAKSDEAARLRDQQMRNLERLAEQFKQEIAARERTIRNLTEANSTVGPEADRARAARLDRTLSKLDDEIFALEMEVLDAEVRLQVLQARIKNQRLDVDAARVRERIEGDTRVASVAAERASKQAKLAELLKREKGDSPAVTELKREVSALDKHLGEAQAAVREEVYAAARAVALQQLRDKEADLEETLTVTRKFVETRNQIRKDLEKRLAEQAKTTLDLAALMRELEPQREQLRKLETMMLELRFGRELGTPAPAHTGGLEVKLDKLLREVEELRKEVRELRKP